MSQYTVKQVIVVRKDLNMRTGKLAAQVAHASMKVFFDRMSTKIIEVPVFPLDSEYKICSGYIMTPIVKKTLHCYQDDPILLWIDGSFAKIVVSCDSEEELYALQKQADDAGIINSLIIDNGSTEFHGEKTATCIAIGPDYSEKIDVITKELKLLWN